MKDEIIYIKRESNRLAGRDFQYIINFKGISGLLECNHFGGWELSFKHRYETTILLPSLSAGVTVFEAISRIIPILEFELKGLTKE